MTALSRISLQCVIAVGFLPVLGLALLCASPAAQAQSVGTTTRLAPFVGHLFTPASGQSNIGFWGTDLGSSFTHGNEIRFLFGDSWADTNGTPIGTTGDDCIGTVSATTFATGDSVESYVNSHGPGFGDLPWQTEGPPVTFPVNNNKIRPLEVYHNGTTPVGMQLLKTPLAGFSNAGTGAFAILSQAAPLECSGPTHTCPTGYHCDQGLGLCPYALIPDPGACVIGTLACNCQPTAGGGLCQDQTSSLYDTSDEGRVLSVPLKYEVGNSDPNAKYKFYSQTWPTNKFISVTARTVQKFDKTTPNDHDWHVAGATGNQRRVFMWGRPHFVGAKALGRDAKLYFAYTDMPSYNATGNFTWAPQYYSGLDGNGNPIFQPNPEQAQPLNLTGFPTSTTEWWDISLYMSVSYVPTLNKWVMLYGGNENPFIILGALGARGLFVQADPQGAIHARFATNPWGPWSPPQQVLPGGDPNIVPPLLGTEYGPLGILHHDACIGLWCAPDESASAYDSTPWGWLYAPLMVDQWTTARGSQADIYWTVSTWAPYETVLYKTRLVP